MCWNRAGWITQAGVALPIPRLTPDYYGQTAVDNLTGLMWTFDSRTPDPADIGVPICTSLEHLVTWQEHSLTYSVLTQTTSWVTMIGDSPTDWS